MVFMSPSVHDISLHFCQRVPLTHTAHCLWYDLSNVHPADAHAHAYTEALSVTALLVTR